MSDDNNNNNKNQVFLDNVSFFALAKQMFLINTIAFLIC